MSRSEYKRRDKPLIHLKVEHCWSGAQCWSSQSDAESVLFGMRDREHTTGLVCSQPDRAMRTMSGEQERDRYLCELEMR